MAYLKSAIKVTKKIVHKPFDQVVNVLDRVYLPQPTGNRSNPSFFVKNKEVEMF